MTRPMLLALALGALACAPRPVDVTAYGEELVEDGIPAEVFVDGWEVSFARFDARLADVALEASGERVSASEAERIVDLAAASDGEGHFVAALPPRAAYEDLTFTVGPSATAPALRVEGTASRGDVTKSFAWSFETETTYVCAPRAASDPDVGVAQITIHADHLFYDDLDSPEPNVAFDLIAAADADEDGVVTRDELQGTDIRTEERYQVGSRGISDLWRYLEAQSGTVGHIDGEGHCNTRR